MDLTRISGPIETARGLPNAHYTDPATLAAETAAVLHGQWAGIAFGSDVAPGSAFPVTFAGQPLLVVRDRDGVLRVFFNVCRHRGMILVAAPGPIRGALRCPYHSWCYGLDGRLVATPHVGGPGHNRHDAVDPDTLGLVEVPSALWRGVVFVNIGGAAGPFAPPIAERWAEFDAPLVAPADSSFDLRPACNWKLAVENYCEAYHLPWVHPGLNAYSRLEDHYDILGDGFAGQGTRVYRQLTQDGRRFPDFPGLSARWDRAAEYIALFPNVLFGVHRDHAYAILLMPEGPAATRERVQLQYAGETDADLRAANLALWRTVFEEDVFVVEGMQKGRHAAGFDGGRFSPAMDGPTHTFHAWVAGCLAPTLSAAD